MFSLDDNQRALLAAARAWQEDGERRFDLWSRRERLQEAAQAFGQALAESGLRTGRALDAAVRARLLRLAGRLAPNTVVSRRLYQDDPADFDRRLRVLFYGDGLLYERLRQFLAPRGMGLLTASQLLSAFAPDTYPLLTRPALRRLRLTAAQQRAAISDAADRYGFTREPGQRPDAAQRLLGHFVAYEAVRDALGESSYLTVDALLRAEASGLPALLAAGSPAPARVREVGGGYTVPAAPELTETVLLAALEEYVAGQGFVFPPHLLRSYYVALKTKPFAILAGVSGTGKTKLVELFAEALTGHATEQFRLIPVRPDWADFSPLLGYHNVLANRYVTTPFLDLARTAARPENRDRAYFACLDEMNLARVEHYLAEYLSALESRGRRIPLHADVPDLVLPPNLFVTGTVNVDETTHAFSRKVLDRANTLDFDDPPRLTEGMGAKGVVSLSEDLGVTPGRRQQVFLGARVASVGRARERLAQVGPGLPDRALSALEAANALLYPQRLHAGYRVRDELLMFLANAFDAETDDGLLVPGLEENFVQALDLQMEQKVLPKLNGATEVLEPILTALEGWAEGSGLEHTAAKLARMRAVGAVTGYVQFYE